LKEDLAVSKEMFPVLRELRKEDIKAALPDIKGILFVFTWLMTRLE
jgi:hypothetical protein